MPRQKQAMNQLKQIIEREIAAQGVISFARFMDLALYHPEHGYYEQDATSPGRRGDFYTSVSVGNLFGELLGFQFAEWFAELPEGTPPQIVEAGAHDGRLASDILASFKNLRPRLFGHIRYIIAEPSPRRRERQKKQLAEFADTVTWISSIAELKHRRFNGVIFSNELLDAMPLHRFGWDAGQKKWFEWGVALEGDRLAWRKI